MTGDWNFQRGMDIYQHHFERMWAGRHDSPHTRHALKCNIRGQRIIKAKMQTSSSSPTR